MCVEVSVKNRLYLGILLAFLPLQGSARGAALSVRLQSVFEGDLLPLPCSDARSWSHRQSANVPSTIAEYHADPHPHYDCVGPLLANGVCISNVKFDAIGTLTLRRVTFNDAGIYECKSALNRMKAWSVTVVRRPSPTLTYAINGISQHVDDSDRFKSVHLGDDISAQCVASFAGFHNPELHLVRAATRAGPFALLKAAFPSVGVTFIPSAKSTLFVKYTVNRSDDAFGIMCRLTDVASNVTSLQLFQRVDRTTPTSSPNSATPDATVMVIVAVLVSLACAGALVVAWVILRRRRLKQQNSDAAGSPAVPFVDEYVAGIQRASNPSQMKGGYPEQSDDLPPYPGATPRPLAHMQRGNAGRPDQPPPYPGVLSGESDPMARGHASYPNASPGYSSTLYLNAAFLRWDA